MRIKNNPYNSIKQNICGKSNIKKDVPGKEKKM